MEAMGGNFFEDVGDKRGSVKRGKIQMDSDFGNRMGQV